MSLHQLAKQVQKAGRNGDSVLVHMTPKEVGGLQALAMAHGGSLTINPETGLPEAFFLAALLPTIAGMGLQAAGMTALQAALTVGAASTIATGSLGKGLMAGFGAYGGAGFGKALGAAGGTGVSANAMIGANAGNQLTSSYTGIPTPTNVGPVPTPAITPNMTPGVPGSEIMKNPSLEGFGVRTPPGGVFSDYMKGNLTTGRPTPDITNIKISTPDPESFGGRLSAMGRGVKEIFSDKDKLFDFVKENPLETASVASALYDAVRKRDVGPGEEDKKPLEKYRYVYDKYPVGTAASRSSERDYFPNARYEATGERYAAASGGLMALANGGSVEQMSHMNAVGANTQYPMADQMTSAYATAAQRPISENIIHPQGDADVNPYTGEPRFASGGLSFSTGGSTPANPYGVPNAYMTGNKGASEEDSAVDFFDYVYNPKTGGYDSKSAMAKSAGAIGQLDEKGALPVQQTRETLNPLYQKYFGRDIDPEGLATYTSRQFSPAELEKIFTGAEEYKTAAPMREAREREATYATPEQASDIYQRVMGRTPDLAGLSYYAKTNRMTPEEMEKSLRSSDEYFYNLTKPFVPAIHYGANGIANIDEAPRYDPTQYGFDPSYTNARNEIKGLYQNQLGRVADPRGEQYWADTIGADNQLSAKDIRKFSKEAAKEMKGRQEGFAAGGLSDLGAYSDGGRLLKGPGDGVSDSIPAVIGERQPARLADGEFVIPARIVSELGNGSTDAGARKLYAMMDRIQKARTKSVGKGKVAANTKSEKYLPA